MIVVSNDEMQIERLTLGPYGTNAYIVKCLKTRECVLIDAPAEAETITANLSGFSPKYLLMTHDHRDHVGAFAELRYSLGVLVAAHIADIGNLSSLPDRLLSHGDTVSVGNLILEVLHTPGHTPGSLCFKLGQYLIAGDTIFPGGPGHTRTPADLKQIIQSITEKIFVLPDDTLIYPGHGDSTVLKKEKDEFAVFASRPHDPNLCGDVLWLSAP